MIYTTVICGLQLALIAWLLHDRRTERQEVRAERADLLLRVSETQQQTVIRHHNEQVENQSPPAVNPDIDEDYFISKEDLARLAAGDEVNHGD